MLFKKGYFLLYDKMGQKVNNDMVIYLIISKLPASSSGMALQAIL